MRELSDSIFWKLSHLPEPGQRVTIVKLADTSTFRCRRWRGESWREWAIRMERIGAIKLMRVKT